MSQSRQKKRTKKREQEAAAAPVKGKFFYLKRRRFALAAAAGMFTMLVYALVVGRESPRITVVNRTGEPLNDVRIDFPGGTVGGGSVPEGDKASFLLRPAADNPQRPGGQITLTYRVGNSAPSKFISRVHGQEYGAHDIINVARQPDGTTIAIPGPEGGGGVGLRDLLKRVGIGR